MLSSSTSPNQLAGSDVGLSACHRCRRAATGPKGHPPGPAGARRGVPRYGLGPLSGCPCRRGRRPCRTGNCASLFLNLISAIQPIRLDNERALDFEADFLRVDRPRLLLSLGVLEEVGVLLRRGNTLRIVPDVLADHILHQVSVTPQGQKTGYADTVFHQFASLCPTEVLRNSI